MRDRLRRLLGAALFGLGCAPSGAAAVSAEAPDAKAMAAASPDAGAEPTIKERVRAKIEARESADRDAATVELPLFQLDTKHIVVDLAIGSQSKLGFIVDTGANMTVITPQTRDAVGMKPDEGMAVRAAGAGGGVAQTVRLVDLADVRVGSRRYDKVGAAVMELDHLTKRMKRPIAGILGRNFLERHDVEVDLQAKRVRLHALGSRRRVDAKRLESMVRVPFSMFEAGLIKVDVRLDDKATVPAVFDLGAGRTVINWKAARAVGVTPKRRGVKPGAEPALGADNKPVATKRFRFQSVGLGTAIFAKPELFIADLPVFEILGIGEGPAMVFGIDQLADRQLIIDYDAKALYLSVPAKP